MGIVTSDTGESWEVPDCDHPDTLQGNVARDEEVICEHGWSFKMVNAGPYGWVLAWARASGDTEPEETVES